MIATEERKRERRKEGGKRKVKRDPMKLVKEIGHYSKENQMEWKK